MTRRNSPLNSGDESSSSNRTRGLPAPDGGSTSKSDRPGAGSEEAGSSGGGGATLLAGRTRAIGSRNRNTIAFNGRNGQDPNRVMLARGLEPGSGGGSGGGRGGGKGRKQGGGESDGEPGSRRGGNKLPGLGNGGTGGGNARGRGTGNDEAGGGEGSGRGSGRGNGRGNGSGGGGSGNGGRRGPRFAGDPWGKLGGEGNGGNGPGGKGKGGNGRGGNGTGDDGPGGPGSGGGGGTRIARGGDGDGDGRGRGNLPGVGGDGGKDKGDGGGNGGGRGNGAGDEAGDGKGGTGRDRKRNNREREGSDEKEIGRGLYKGLTGRFYQDADLSDKETQMQLEQGKYPINWDVFTRFITEKKTDTIDFDWGVTPPAPGMLGKFWSAKWKGKIFVPKDDTYQFSFEALDDAGRLFLDGNKIIDVWRVQKSNPASSKIKLDAGPHDIEIHYVQGPATEASLRLKWSSTSFPEELVGPYVDAQN